MTDAAGPEPERAARDAEADAAAERAARRLYRRAIAWGVLTLVFLWWFSRHWKV